MSTRFVGSQQPISGKSREKWGTRPGANSSRKFVRCACKYLIHKDLSGHEEAIFISIDGTLFLPDTAPQRGAHELTAGP